MEIYYYCSYTGSPVGFQMGKLTYDGQSSGTLTMESPDAPTFIQRCFDQRAVRKAYQYSGEKGKEFFFLLKGLSAKGKRPEDPAEYYINFAVVSHQWEDFLECFRNIRGVSDDKIADAVRDTMQVDKESEFGFTICGDNIPNLLDISYHAQFRDIRHLESKNIALGLRKGKFLELLSPHTNFEQLMQVLKYSGNCSKMDIPGNWIELGKNSPQKKNSAPAIANASGGSLVSFKITRPTRRRGTHSGRMK